MSPFTYNQIKPIAHLMGITIPKIHLLSCVDNKIRYEVEPRDSQLSYSFDSEPEVIAFVMGYAILFANQLRDSFKTNTPEP